jgi:aryl-alcohol dehydrogenase-like predicted oxidoreductase
MERQPFESDLLPVVEKYNLGVIPYFALAAGFLTGKYRSAEDAANAARGKMVEKYLNDRGFAVVAALDSIAKEYNSTPARVSLAWLIAQPGVTSAIASATNDKQLDDLIEATKLKLNPDAIETLNEVSAPVTA